MVEGRETTHSSRANETRSEGKVDRRSRRERRRATRPGARRILGGRRERGEPRGTGGPRREPLLPPPPKRKKEECLPAAKDRVLARLFGSSPPSFPRASPPSPRSRSRPLATPSASSSSSSLPTTSSSGLLRFAALSGPRVVLASLGGGSILHPEKGSSFECERRIWKFWLGNSMS